MTRVTKDKCLDIINRFEPSKEGRRKGQLGIDGRQMLRDWALFVIAGGRVGGEQGQT